MLQENDKTTNFLIIPLGLLIALLAGVGLFVMFSDCATQVVGELFGTIISGEKERQEILGSRQETLRFIGWLMGGLLAAIGVIMIGRRADAQIENNKIASENNRLIEKGHIEDRVRSATELLAQNQTGSSIAAFYQFYYLAKTSDIENFQKNIFDILCSHLRDKTRKPEYQKDNKTKPSEEIQTLLDILFKPENKYDSKEEGKSAFRKLIPDLQRVHLAGADLSRACLPQADFSDACLIGANMENAKLHKCIFARTKMHGTNLHKAKMQLAIFNGTKLIGSNLFKANMQGSVLEIKVHLHAACISKTQMQGVQFYGTSPSKRNSAAKAKKSPLDLSHSTFVGGAYPYPDIPYISDYENIILKQVDKKGNIDGVYFSGGISKDKVDDTVKFLKKYINEQAAKDYQERIQEHIEKPLKEMTEEDCNNLISLIPYQQKHAKEWIDEYNKVMKPTATIENT